MKIENCKTCPESVEGLKIESIPDGIDLNFGCPARDITKTGAGAALLKNQKLAAHRSISTSLRFVMAWLS